MSFLKRQSIQALQEGSGEGGNDVSTDTLVIKKNEHTLEQLYIPYWIKLTLVALVYTFQGIAFEFLVLSVEIELVLNGAEYESLGLLSLMQYPWCMKLFWAPLQDAYFIKKLGRRKTWILATYIGLSALWTYFIFYVEDYLLNLRVIELTIIGTATSFLLAFQDVSMDGWIVKLADDDKQLGIFSWWCSFGYPLGGLIAFNVYVWFSSEDWCQTFLRSGPLMDSTKLVAFTTFGFVIVAIMVVFVPEAKDHFEAGVDSTMIEDSLQPPGGSYVQLSLPNHVMAQEPYQQRSNMKKIMQKLKQFVKNKNLLLLMVFLFMSEIGFVYFDNLGPLELLQNGMDTNSYAFVWLLSTIAEGIAGYIIAKIIGKRYMTFFFIGFLLRTANSGFAYYILWAMKGNMISDQLGVILYGGEYIIDGIEQAFNAVSIYTFIMHICDNEVEGSYLAIITSIFFAAPIWPTTIVYILADYVDWQILCIGSLLYNALFVLIFGKRIIALEKADLDSWKLTDN